MPFGGDDFLGSEGNGLLGGGCVGEDTSVADKDAHYEEGAREVAEEGESPVL